MSETPASHGPTASSGDDAVRDIRFETADTGVTVVDEIERKREHLGTRPAVEPVPVSTAFWRPSTARSGCPSTGWRPT